MGGREMEERGKLRVERGCCCHLERWVAEGRENKSWSCGAGPEALKANRDETSSATVSVKRQARSIRRIAPVVRH